MNTMPHRFRGDGQNHQIQNTGQAIVKTLKL
jgi:hypothetical protein